MFFTDRSLVPSISDNLVSAKYFSTTLSKLAAASPYLIFSFMYQPIVPIIYEELKHKSSSRMRRVLVLGSIFVIGIYVLDSSFGYL